MPDKPLTPSSRVSAEIRGQMARLRMTQAALGARIGMVQATVSGRLCGRTPWTIDELTEVAAALDVPLAQILPLDDLQAAS